MTGVELRPIADADQEFLFRLYASTREQELSVVDWSDEEKERFLRMQFDAQHQHYTTHFTGARFDLLERDGAPVGRLYVDRRADEIRVIDIALVPELRGKGIGAGLMREILEEARRAGVPVRIHVERDNPAQHLYQRLGFVPIEEQGVYWLMEWRPTGTPDTHTQEKS